ncbi:hypothetical protein Tco_0344730 [Tanacetum coccineum]
MVVTLFRILLLDVPTSYDNKLTPALVSKANIQKLDANVPNDADFDIWLTSGSIHEGSDLMLRDSLWMICEVLIFLNNESSLVSLLKEELSRVLVLVKFHDVLLVAYTSDGLSLIATKIGPGYTKETIRVEYKWEPPRCSTYIVIGHLVDDCPKASKHVVNRMDKGKGGSSGADDDRLIEASPKTAPPVNMKKVFIPGNSLNKTAQMNVSTSCNGTIYLSNSFEVLNDNNSVAEDVDSGDRIVMSSVQEEGQNSTPLVDNINLVEQRLLEGKCMLLDDDGKPVKMIDYTSDHDSDDEL